MTIGQKTISFEVRDWAGRCVPQELTVQKDQAIGEIRPQIIESLKLSEYDFGGQPTTWHLYKEADPENQRFSDADMVKDVIEQGQTVVVSPNIVAGQRN